MSLWLLYGAQILVVIFICPVMYRLVRGPTAADRLVALNVLGALVLAFLVVRGVAQSQALYLDVALVYDIFGFLGLLAIARYLKDKDEGVDQ